MKSILLTVKMFHLVVVFVFFETVILFGFFSKLIRFSKGKKRKRDAFLKILKKEDQNGKKSAAQVQNMYIKRVK